MARKKEFDEIEVLDKAVQLFWNKGYNATSANDLVDALGLSRSSIYSTYDNKRTLFIRSLDRYRKQVVNSMLEMVKQSNDFPKTISEVFRMVIEQDVGSKIPKGCLIVNSAVEVAAEDREIAEIVNANSRDIERVFEAAIKKGQDSGQVSSSHSPKVLARFLNNNISGLRVAVKASNDLSELDDVVKICLSVLMDK